MFRNIAQLLQISQSAMLAYVNDLDIVSHNLANTNTVGFKSSRVNFQELLQEQERAGIQVRTTQRLMSQGDLSASDNPLDLAIEGQGFFAIELGDGRTAYTRDGQFQLDSANQIVTPGGYKLTWNGKLPEGVTDIHFNPDGTIMALENGVWAQAGTVELSRFANASALESFGQNLWLETEVSGEAEAGAPQSEGFGQIVSNAIERSNVNLANELTRMVSLQRAFQMSTRSFQQTDRMISKAIDLRRS